MFQFLNNVPPVTKNLLLINVLMYVITLIFANQIDLISLLGAHYINSPLFQPYQVVTYFFMHSTSPFHILFNMFALVMFGSLLERMWGPKRFFIFYVASALGAFVLYNVIGFYDIMQLKKQIVMAGFDLDMINDEIRSMKSMGEIIKFPYPLLQQYAYESFMPMVGASGAVFGIMAGFAYLFPNTEMMLMFLPVPIKAKYLIGGYFLIEVYLSFQNSGDGVAHLAHVGGAIVGFILVLVWNRTKKTFY